jgi:hypothetical protein
MSMQIIRQCRDGVGTHFAHHICFLACHYQLFEYLLPQKWGKYLNRSLLNNEQVQMVARIYLSSLSIGEVTLSCFHHMLNECILPSLRYTLKHDLSECMA